MRAYRHETRRRGLSFYADGHEQTINDPWANDLCGYGYGYNGDNQKTSCAEYGYNGGSYANVAWGYDPLGHLSRETRSGGSARTASYVVDGVGNRTSQTVNGATTTFSYDADDELTSDSAGGLYQYDANGNENGRRRGGGWIYPYYTNENQIAVTYTGGQYPAYSYGYDALGRQVVRYDPAGTRTDYQYDGSSVLTEQQGGGTTSRYLRGSDLLMKYGEAPQFDGLGSMRQGVDISSGRYTGQADFSAFGEMIGGSNPGAFQSVYQWGAQGGCRTDGAGGTAELDLGGHCHG